MGTFSVDKHKGHEQMLNLIYGEIKELRSEMKVHNFHMKMRTVDLCEFFPVENDEQIEAFLDRNHDDWISRQNTFHDLLYNCISEYRKKLGGALVHLLFSRQYIREHKWPMSGGYDKIVIYLKTTIEAKPCTPILQAERNRENSEFQICFLPQSNIGKICWNSTAGPGGYQCRILGFLAAEVLQHACV